MNHEQWESLKAATKGHTPGPWQWHKREGSEDYERKFEHVGPIGHNNPCGDDDSWVQTTVPNATLAAAAPDLLAEVERLREWMAFADGNIKDEWLQRIIAGALNGEEVPE